jgi:predicted DNA-binding protein
VAKAAQAKVAVSARVSPEVAADIEAIVSRTGRTKTEVIEDLIRAGLDAGKPTAERVDKSAEALAQVLAAVEGLKARANAEPPKDTANIADLVSEVESLQRRTAELVNADAESVKSEIKALKNGLGVVLVTMLGRVFPDMPKEEVRQMVKKSFDS